MSPALMWFRRDLRLADNPALRALLAQGHTPVPVFTLDDPDPHWPLGAASAWWLHHSLAALKAALQQRGSDLLLLRGDSQTQLADLATRSGASAVYWNRDYTPGEVQRDEKLKTRLRQQGTAAHSHSAALLREPWQALKKDGTPYRVFTPFWKNLQRLGPCRELAPQPKTLPALPAKARRGGIALDALELLPTLPWDQDFYAHWQPGEAGAWAALKDFSQHELPDYTQARDMPALSGTSYLSAHLHFGEISPLQVWQHIQRDSAANPAAGRLREGEAYLRQIAWREFSQHLLFHFPHTPEQPLDTRFATFPWRRQHRTLLTRWQQGQTGIPIVDAGMRELWATGYMHNRVRMIAASFLTKNLLIPWQTGARWFWDTLVDADLANNTLGWQWVAGCGADAAPYFRIFNPVLQGEKFDRDGSYVRRWVPELSKLGSKHIHHPWDADPAVLADANIRLGKDYPRPAVDLKASRHAALEAWEQIKHREKT